MPRYLKAQANIYLNRMKKSQLKQLIKEVITEIDAAGKLSQVERRRISVEIHRSHELTGNAKVTSLSKGITILAKALDAAGFNLDMVSGDLLLGPQGHRRLTFRRKNPEGENAFIEAPQIENSHISFSWTNLGDEYNKKYEIVAYPS